MIELNNFMERFADEIGGQFSEYNKEKSVIIVPLEQNRFQAVLGAVRKSNNNQQGFEFTSKVCEFSDKVDLSELMKRNHDFIYAKFVVVEDLIKVEASAFLVNANEELLKEMIYEVAKGADEWEYKLTGLDVN